MRAQRFDHAVVLGGSMAGLLAARVLADCFARVTILERDALEHAAAHRKGTPQAHHAHGLLARGARFLAERFPGFPEQVVAAGGRVADAGTGVRWLGSDGERIAASVGAPTFQLSRPALEALVRRRVAALPNVALHGAAEVTGVRWDGGEGRFAAVSLRDSGGHASEIAADLCVDARGRASRIVEWLRAHRQETPPETRIEIDLAYTTNIYRAPENARGLAVTVGGERGTRLGVLLRLEGGRWMATLGGYCNDAAPRDDAGFRAFARSLASPAFSDAIDGLEPLEETRSFRTPASIRRHFERIAAPAPGLIALGDAACAFNPIFGQGMSSAAMQAESLAEALSDAPSCADGRRFVRSFYARSAAVVDLPWGLACGEDLRVPGVRGERPLGFSIRRCFADRLRVATTQDAEVAAAFIRVAHLLAPLRSLYAPALLARIWRASERRGPARAAGLAQVSAGPSA
jgi:2-polyprenyl-6-methoxyphenol hydroxylase-like FAD-dependent oxidoreductase